MPSLSTTTLEISLSLVALNGLKNHWSQNMQLSLIQPPSSTKHHGIPKQEHSYSRCTSTFHSLSIPTTGTNDTNICSLIQFNWVKNKEHQHSLIVSGFSHMQMHRNSMCYLFEAFLCVLWAWTCSVLRSGSSSSRQFSFSPSIFFVSKGLSTVIFRLFSWRFTAFVRMNQLSGRSTNDSAATLLAS